MSVADEYRKALMEAGELEKTAVDNSTKAQLDALAENKKLVEAEKQNATRGAYVDYANNINPYGVQSELAYGSGLGGAGKGETAQANYYNTYQNRLGEINTAATGQLRDIAQQEVDARLAADQAKLSIDSSINQQLAAAAREDRANAYNQLITAISSTGYTPTDEELAAAGMTRNMANSYRTAYQQSLYSSSSTQYDSLSESQLNKVSELQEEATASGDWTAYSNYVDDLENVGNIDPATIDYLRYPLTGQGWGQNDWVTYFKAIHEEEGSDSASALLQEYINAGKIPQSFVAKASVAANGMMR